MLLLFFCSCVSLSLLQIPALVRMAKEALETERCCVIGLQSTGEARTADVVAERGEELDDFVSGPRVRSLLKTLQRPCSRRHAPQAPPGDSATKGASSRSNVLCCMRAHRPS